MRRRSLAVASLALALAPACRARRAAPAPPRWVVRPADGPALRVEGGDVVRGALRAENGAAARPPHPASPLAATARLADGAWLFAAEDGTVYRAATFTGALAVVGALPFRLEPAPAREGRPVQGVHSRGALAVVDVDLRAHAVAADGRHRSLGLARVLSACFASAREALAVTEPGVLHVSRDGGAHFAVVRPPAGVPLAVWNADDRTLVRTTAGTFRWAGGTLAPDASAPTTPDWLRVPAEVDARLAAAFDPVPALRDPERVAVVSPGTLATVEGRALVLRDARTGRERAREELPGEGCRVFTAYRGVRALCRHQGWALVLAARAADRAGWTVLRDEARAEPMDALAFDDASPAWAVAAPCAQRPVRDPRDVCLYDAAGTPHDVRLPAPAALAAVHAGAALAVGHGERPEGYLVTPAGATEVALPDDARAPVLARWTAAGLALLHATPAATLALSVRAGEPPRWRRVAAPDGHARGLFTPRGEAVTWGRDARSLAWWRGGRAFAPMPSPVVGSGAALALDLDAPGYCVGPWCRFGGVLTLGPEPAARVLARADAPPAPPRALPAQRGVRCEHGATTEAPEIDHGVAASGYAMRWSLAGGRLAVTWSGETLRGAMTAAVAARPGARTFGRGVQGARVPAGLVELCAPTGCDHLLVTARGALDLGLGRATQGGVEVQAVPGGWVARADDLRDGVALVTLVRVSAEGAVVARRTFALADRTDGAHAGTWEGRDGLWIADREGALRFAPIAPEGGAEGADGAVTVPAPDAATRACAADVTGTEARGEVRMLTRVAQVRGPGWFVEAGEWQSEEVLAVDRGAVCVRAMTAGEAKDEDEARASGRVEHEPVRSFVLAPAAGGGFEGRAWSGERAIALRCAWE